MLNGKEQKSLAISRPKAYSYVRFSSAVQEQGDSVRRQKKIAESIAKENNLDLQATFRDFGISAFRGKNAKHGSLAEFVDHVHSGNIKKGSWLIIESLDRFSRDKLVASTRRITELLELGIVIATKDKVYTSESADSFETMILIMAELMRAHSESSHKSQRVSEANSAKRSALVKGEGMVIPTPPWWIKREGKEYIVIEERARVIRRIVHLVGKGYSLRKAGISVQQEFPDLERQFGSEQVRNLFQSKMVLGIPRWKSEHKEFTDGDDLLVYPAIITEEEWIKAKLASEKLTNLTDNRKKRSEVEEHLFKSKTLCSCGSTLSKMSPSPAGYLKIKCSGHSRGKPCDSKVKSISLFPIEIIFCSVISSFSCFYSNSSEKRKLEEEAIVSAKMEAAKVTERLETIETRRSRATDMLLDSDDSELIPTLKKRVKELDVEANELKRIIADINSRVYEMIESVSMQVSGTGFDTLIGEITQKKTRQIVHENLQKYIDRIVFNSEKTAAKIHLNIPSVSPINVTWDKVDGIPTYKMFRYSAEACMDGEQWFTKGNATYEQISQYRNFMVSLRA